MKHQKNKILEEISKHVNGQRIWDIQNALGVERSILNSELEELVKSGKIRKVVTHDETRFFSEASDNLYIEIPLSPESKCILEQLGRTPQIKSTISYKRDLLENYIPNITRYLSEKTCRELSYQGEVKRQSSKKGICNNILNKFLINFSWNSSRLEGNTFTLSETQKLLLLGDNSAERTNEERQMILNHKSAIEFIHENFGEISTNLQSIQMIHKLLSEELISNKSACGNVRFTPVSIGGSNYVPIAIPQLLEELMNEILEKATAILDPFEQAFFLMVHIPYLQYFEDINKRTSRLAANIPLIKGNFYPITFVDLPPTRYIEGLLGVYELNKIELLRDIFIWSYSRSVKQFKITRGGLGSPDLFREKYRKEIKSLIQRAVLDQLTAVDVLDFVEEHIPKNDQKKFAILIEEELYSLHIGNIASYRISPQQFHHWKKNFEG